MALVELLLAGFAASSREAAADRRALYAEALARACGSREAAAGRIATATGQPCSVENVRNLITRARKARANPDRLAAALALGGPIPTGQPDRRACAMTIPSSGETVTLTARPGLADTEGTDLVVEVEDAWTDGETITVVGIDADLGQTVTATSADGGQTWTISADGGRQGAQYTW
jgi:hypothetical protein